MVGQASVVTGPDESAAGFDSAVLFVRLEQKGEGGDKQGRIRSGGDTSAVYLFPHALELYRAALGWKFVHSRHQAVGQG